MSRSRAIWRAPASAKRNVERALDWLADLAEERERPHLRGDGSFRVFAPEELRAARCAVPRTADARWKQRGILSPSQREIVIDRLLALDTEELDLDQVKWVVLMVLVEPARARNWRMQGWKIWYSMTRIATPH